MAKEKLKQVTVRMPQKTITRIAKIAKLARVSPTQVYNVMMASYILSTAPDAAHGEEGKNG